MKTVALAVVVVAACVLGVSAYGNRMNPHAGKPRNVAWDEATAQSKQKTILAAVASDPTPWPYPTPTEIGTELTYNMNVTFDTVSDIMPAGRRKYIHPRGFVGGFRFLPAFASPYTGGFNGAEYGIVRFSLAAPPDASGIIPASAWKFLRDGVPSGDMFAMPLLAPQSSFDFFSNDEFSNMPPHVPNAPPNSFPGILAKKFSEATQCIHALGVRDVGTRNEDGTLVANVVTPFKVMLKPGPNMHTPDTYPQDFGASFAKIPVGSVLMEATALRYPDSEPEPLGTFELTTSLSTTLYGDTKLFFEHGRMEADIEANPEWFRRGLNESYVCYGHV